MFKKVLLSLLASVILLTTAVPFVHAQSPGPWYNQNFAEWYTKVYSTDVSPPAEIFGERYTAAQVQWVLFGLFSFVINLATGGNSDLAACIISGSEDFFGCIQQYSDLLSLNIQKAPSDSPVFAILFPKNRSLSGIGYITDKLVNLNIIPEAQAQGFGFSALGPIQEAWRAFRDITYGFFILFIIILAFMIMFRVRLSPQTVITVQSALPRVIISLILVTFSFAIAGFMVDLVYVVIGLLAWLSSTGGAFGLFTGASWGEVFGFLTNGIFGLGILGWLVLYWPLFILGMLAAWWQIILSGASALIGIGAANVIIGILGGSLGVIFAFLSVIALVFISFKVILLLLKTYVSILLLTIFAPLQIGIGALVPGAGFTRWLRSLAANLAVYPVVGVMLIISYVFLEASFEPYSQIIGSVFGTTPTSLIQSGADVWYPPLTFGAQASSFNPLPLLWLFASFGIIAVIPRAGDIIKGMIEGRQLAFGSDIAGVAGIATTPVAYPIRQTVGTYTESQRRQAMDIIGEKAKPFWSKVLRKTERQTR